MCRGTDPGETVDDKWLTYQFFVRNGHPAPATSLAADLIAPSTVPLLVKPRRGSAAKGIIGIESGETVPRLGDHIAQERIFRYRNHDRYLLRSSRPLRLVGHAREN